MNKTEVQDALRSRGIAFDETATKADLEALLKAATASAASPATVGEIKGGAEPGEGVQEGGGLPPVAITTPEADPSTDEIRDGLEKFLSSPATDEIPEIEIIAKIRAGLTRDQAIEVINNQRAHDKALASA